MNKYYILDGHEVVPCDLMTWAKQFETTSRQVARYQSQSGDVTVSTVFLGLDHSFGDGPPLLFETLVFDGPMDQEMDRYSTWSEAEAGHAAMVQRVKAIGEGK